MANLSNWLLIFNFDLLTFSILKKLRIPTAITALTLLYLGFSPAIVNSALTLYSEIFTYPFILGIILMGARVWELVQKDYSPRLLLCSLGIGILFVAIMFVKAIFEYILLIFLVPFFYLLLKSLLTFFQLKTLRKSIHAFSKNLNEGSTGFHIKIFKENHVLGLFPREERSLYWTSSTSLI